LQLSARWLYNKDDYDWEQYTEMNNSAAEQRGIKIPFLLFFAASGGEFNPKRLKETATKSTVQMAHRNINVIRDFYDTVISG
jgi:hypothetical protein